MQHDLERRFGSLRRLHGDAGYCRLRSARAAVVGLGGVGSWTVEALARCGVAGLVLIDYDHVSESNVNRQIQATSETLGQAKGEALRERIALVHPGCEVTVVDAFAAADNWPQLLPGPVDALVDACDQVRAKAVLAAWAVDTGSPFVTVGAAGGKQQPERLEIGDLAEVTHDPLLAALRQRLRKEHGAPRTGAMGVRCVYSREPVRAPVVCQGDAPVSMDAGAAGGSLNCHGYGSSVMVTASFGLAAAAEAVRLLLKHRGADIY